MTAGRAGLRRPKAREGRAEKFSPGKARIPPDRGWPCQMLQIAYRFFSLRGTTIQLPKIAAGGRASGLNSAAVGGCHISQSGPEKTGELLPGSGRWKGRDLATDGRGRGQESYADAAWRKGARGGVGAISLGTDALMKEETIL